MKNFKINILVFISFLCFSDFFVGRVLNLLYFKQSTGVYANTTYVINSSKEDIIILGSSKASHHYNSKLISDSLNLSVFNGGKDGSSILLHQAIAICLLNRYSPKLLILDVSSMDLYDKKQIDDNLTSILPYYKSKPEIRDIIASRGPFEKLKHISSIYPYNSTILSLLANVVKPNRNQDINGYAPLIGTLNYNKIDTMDFKELELDQIKINSIEGILKICKKRNVNCIIVQSPRYLTLINDKAGYYLSWLSKKYNYPYISYVNDKFYSNKFLFKDGAHLNSDGANIFSNSFVKKLKLTKNY